MCDKIQVFKLIFQFNSTNTKYSVEEEVAKFQKCSHWKLTLQWGSLHLQWERAEVCEE